MNIPKDLALSNEEKQYKKSYHLNLNFNLNLSDSSNFNINLFIFNLCYITSFQRYPSAYFILTFAYLFKV